MTMSPVYVWAKCKGWAYTTQERVSPPIWSFSFFISVWIRSVQQLLIVVNSHNAIQHHDYRCYTTANLLVLFDAAVVWFVWALYLVFGWQTTHTLLRWICECAYSMPLLSWWFAIIQVDRVLRMGLGTHIHGQYLHGIQIPPWTKKKHTNTSIYRCCRLAFYWGRLVLLDLLLL